MSAAKIGLGVAAGYLLGRTKKFKLAITVGSMLAGQRVATNPHALMKQFGELAEKNPELAKLQDRLKGELFAAARNAAISVATDRLDSANRALTSGRGRDQDEDEYDDQDQDDESDSTEDEDSEDEPEDEYDDSEEEAEDDSDDEAEDEPEDEYDDSEDEADDETEDDSEDEPEDEY